MEPCSNPLSRPENIIRVFPGLYSRISAYISTTNFLGNSHVKFREFILDGIEEIMSFLRGSLSTSCHNMLSLINVSLQKFTVRLESATLVDCNLQPGRAVESIVEGGGGEGILSVPQVLQNIESILLCRDNKLI